jgi:hypothetical protein
MSLHITNDPTGGQSDEPQGAWSAALDLTPYASTIEVESSEPLKVSAHEIHLAMLTEPRP